MLIDIHAHLWDGRFEENRREILKACRAYSIDRVYISSIGSYSPSEEEIHRLNRETHRFMTEEPDTIGGFCYVNPIHKNCTDVLRRCVEEYGMSGMKLWVATFCDDPRVYPLVGLCVDYRIPVLIHAFHKATQQLENESLGSHVAHLAGLFPQARLIMAHLGANCHREIKSIRNCKNVCTDISGSLFRRDDVDYTKEQIGAERILFGTDMPGNFLVNYGQIEEADLTAGERELIYSGNALRLLERNCL